MDTVRKSSKITVSLFIVVVAVIFIRREYLLLDYSYFNVVKAYMMTKASIGKGNCFLINMSFWVIIVDSIICAVLNNKYSFDISKTSIISVFWSPLLIMIALAVFFIPSVESPGYASIHLFWLICYTFLLLGMWLSAKQLSKNWATNTNLKEILKKEKGEESEKKLEIHGSCIDFYITFGLYLLSLLFIIALVISAISFGIKNRELIKKEDDLMPFVLSARYDTAISLMDRGEYDKALNVFRDLDDYSESKIKATKCENLLYGPIYREAVTLLHNGRIDEAKTRFRSIYDYKDSAKKIEACDNLLYGPQYEEAVAIMNEGEYSDALEIFSRLEQVGYRYEDTHEQVKVCKYHKALSLMDENEYEDALEIFEELESWGYDGAQEMIDECRKWTKVGLVGTWIGEAGSRFVLKEDMTCHYIDGGGPEGDGTWDVVDEQLVINTSALSYPIYGDLVDGYRTTTVLIKSDSSSWRDENFSVER